MKLRFATPLSRTLGLALALALVVVPLAFLVPWGKAANYSAYDDGPTHLATYRELFPAPEFATHAIVSTPLVLRDLADPTGHVYVAAGVEREYTDDEVDALVGFVDRGGRILLMDDFQKANPLASRFGVQFDGTPLLDTRYNGTVRYVRSDGLVAGKSYPNLLFNGPSTLSVPATTPNVTYLVNSSADSYADVNADGNITDDDRQGPFPMAVSVSRGGRVIAVFIADAGPFANRIFDYEEDPLLRNTNRAFAKAVATLLAPDGKGVVYFDESRHANGFAEPSYRFLALAVGAARSPVGVGLLAVAAVGAAVLLVATGLKEADRRHVQQLGVATPRVIAAEEARERLRALVLAKLESQANVADAAAFAQGNRGEAERLLKDAALAAFVATPATSYSEAEWTRILDAAGRYLE